MTFVDAGPFLARYHENDQHHAEAVAGWRDIEKQGEPCLTSNLVLSEAFTLLGRRMGYSFAADRAERIYASVIFTILRPDEADEREALALFRKFSDQRVSFTDCVSFALMKRHRIRRAFAFDVHFAYAGFRLWPSRT